MDFCSLFSERLAEERKRLGLGQEEAGSACGVSREMWGKYERAKAVMGADKLALFGATGADVCYILTGERNGAPPAAPALTAEEQTLLDYFRSASPVARRAAMGALLGAAGTARQVFMAPVTGNQAAGDMHIYAKPRKTK